MESIDDSIICRKEEIITLCKKIISGHTDTVEVMREINFLNYGVFDSIKGYDIIENIIPSEELSNFCTLFDDETELIPNGQYREYCSRKFLEQMDA